MPHPRNDFVRVWPLSRTLSHTHTPMAVPTVDPTALLARDAASAAAAWEGADTPTLDAEVAAYRTLLARLRADLALAGVPCNLEDGDDGEAEAIEGVEVSEGGEGEARCARCV